MASHEVEAHGAHEHEHPSPRRYIEIAVVLALITITEVFVLYIPNPAFLGIEAFRPALIPIFIVLSAVKFVVVVGWYMHLRFDDPFFRRMFGFALLIAMMVATAFIALFHGIYFG